MKPMSVESSKPPSDALPPTCNLIDVMPWATDFILYGFSIIIGGLGIAQYAETHTTKFADWLALWTIATWYALTSSGVCKAYAEALKRMKRIELSTGDSYTSQYLRVTMNHERFPKMEKKLEEEQSYGLSVTRYVRYTLMALMYGVGLTTGAYIHRSTSKTFHDHVSGDTFEVTVSTSYEERWYSGFIVLAIMQLAVNFLPLFATVLSLILLTR